LLSTFDEERRFCADATLRQSLARLSAWFADPGKKLPRSEPLVDDFNVIFGQLYPGGALVAERETANSAFEDPRTPSGRPGTRAPHLWLHGDDGPVAVHDLIGRDFLLLADMDGRSWNEAAASATRQGTVAVRCVRVGEVDGDSELPDRFRSSYGLRPGGAALIRPDGFIAWRSSVEPEDAAGTLQQVLHQILGQASPAPVATGARPRGLQSRSR
jgi:hypothetical protein